MKSSQKLLILDWLRKVHKLEWAHRFESQKWKKTNFILGITSLVLASIVSMVPNLPGVESDLVKIIVPIVSGVVAIISGLQTFLKPSEISEKFRTKSDELEALRHHIEEMLEFSDENESQEDRNQKLETIRTKWSKIGSLNASDKNFQKAGHRIDALNRYPKHLTFSE